MDEIVTAIASFIAGKNHNSNKRVKFYISFFLGFMFFFINIFSDIIQKNEIPLNNILVLFGLSLFISLATYLLLVFSKN